jgi:flagellin-like hook-associated protein FlgL
MTGFRINKQPLLFSAKMEEDLRKSTEKLAMRLRIASPADDTAGFSLAKNLETDKKLFSRATKNISDGLSMTGTATSALKSLENIIVRQSELASYARNSGLSTVQRNAVQEESNKLTDEYNRIVQTADYNSIELLKGNLNSGVGIQAGIRSGSEIPVAIGNYLSGSGTTSVTVSSTTTTINYAASSATLAMSANTDAMTVGDFNGDGHMDVIASVDSTGNTINLFYGNGNGTFNSRTTSFNIEFANDMEAHDFNGDGISDIATNTNNTTYAVQIRNGSSFGWQGNLGVGTNRLGSELEVVDINNDGFKDIIASNYNTASDPIIAYLSNGSGFSFSGPYTTPVSVASDKSDMAFGSLNGDSFNDMAYLATDGNIVIMTGNGNGYFATGATLSLGSSAGWLSSVEIADFNGDGNQDVMASGAMGGGASVLFVGNGNGTFKARQTFSNLAFSDVQVTDYDSDGDNDIFGVTQTQMVLLNGNGDGTFSVGKSFSISGDPLRVELADFNEDGIVDVATSAYWDTNLRVFLSSTSVNTTYTTTTVGASGSSMSYLDLSTATTAEVEFNKMSSMRDAVYKESASVASSTSRMNFALNLAANQKNNAEIDSKEITELDSVKELSEYTRLTYQQKISSYAFDKQVDMVKSMAELVKKSFA